MITIHLALQIKKKKFLFYLNTNQQPWKALRKKREANCNWKEDEQPSVSLREKLGNSARFRVNQGLPFAWNFLIVRKHPYAFPIELENDLDVTVYSRRTGERKNRRNSVQLETRNDRLQGSYSVEAVCFRFFWQLARATVLHPFRRIH